MLEIVSLFFVLFIYDVQFFCRWYHMKSNSYDTLENDEVHLFKLLDKEKHPIAWVQCDFFILNVQSKLEVSPPPKKKKNPRSI